MIDEQEWRARRNLRRSAYRFLAEGIVGGVAVWLLYTLQLPYWVETVLVFLVSLFAAGMVISAVISGLQGLGVGRGR